MHWGFIRSVIACKYSIDEALAPADSILLDRQVATIVKWLIKAEILLKIPKSVKTTRCFKVCHKVSEHVVYRCLATTVRTEGRTASSGRRGAAPWLIEAAAPSAIVRKDCLRAVRRKLPSPRSWGRNACVRGSQGGRRSVPSWQGYCPCAHACGWGVRVRDRG